MVLIHLIFIEFGKVSPKNLQPQFGCQLCCVKKLFANDSQALNLQHKTTFANELLYYLINDFSMFF